MSTGNRIVCRMLFTLVCVIALGLAFEPSAFAYKRNSKATGPGGNSISQSVGANRTATGYNRNATTTGPRNKSVSTDTSGNWDKSTNTWTKDKTVTGPQGESKTVEKQTTISK